ncbi:MAG: phosphate signaling complex protein PhoU [Daejeonella sp.]
MTHLESELQELKKNLAEMWALVRNQLLKAKESLLTEDKDLAREVIAGEKRVNAFELSIDNDCENIFALYNPVAVDLRLVLAIIKINNNLERQGDSAQGIAKFVLSLEDSLDMKLVEKTRIMEMFDENILMLDELTESFGNEDGIIARKIFKRDEFLDEINDESTSVIAKYIRENIDIAEQALRILSIIRKLERVGDHSKNIAEEIIFYTEAKVLKHVKKDKKK